jgi:hypothetical protein
MTELAGDFVSHKGEQGASPGHCSQGEGGGSGRSGLISDIFKVDPLG